MSHRLLLADDHELFSDGLRELLGQQPDLEVVAEARDGREAVRAARRARPELVLMDLAMPGLNGVEATRRITSELGFKVLALSMHREARFVEAALEAGAQGYLLKSSAFEELVAAIRTVLAGRTYLSPAIAGTVVQALRSRPAAVETAYTVLSEKEREVLQLLAEGLSTQQIASRLGRSPRTVHSHRERIMDKLDVHSLAGLIRYALEEGLA